ncbi:MAG: SDR family NAD(P)-dependent oxidoreductase [Limisphaerales bacterium]
MRIDNDETVLITGASSGIGLELAKFFAAENAPHGGSKLILVARNQPALEALADELKTQYHAEAMVLPADLSQPDAPKKIFDQLQAANIHVNVLVNNAGFGAIGAFAQLPMERQIEMIQVNVTALTALTRLFLPGMVRAGRGGILNVASVAGFVTGPGMAVYYATKAFVLSFSEALAAELEGTGVIVSVLCPGPTITNFGLAAGAGDAKLFRVQGMTAEAVARDGHRDFRRGKVVAVSGIQNKLMVLSIRFAPRWVLRKMVRKFNGFSK